MFQLSEKKKENIIQDLKWRFNLSDEEIKDVLDKTISYLNTLKETLQINSPKHLESIAEKLIRIS